MEPNIDTNLSLSYIEYGYQPELYELGKTNRGVC